LTKNEELFVEKLNQTKDVWMPKLTENLDKYISCIKDISILNKETCIMYLQKTVDFADWWLTVKGLK
jgi:hypothetical protein